MKKHCSLLLALSLGLFASVYQSLGGSAVPILINVDLSDPSAAVFSGTGAFPFSSDSSSVSSNGISLVNFFFESTGSGVQPVSSSSLQPLLGGTNFTLWRSDTYNGGPGLNIAFFDTTATPQLFNSSIAAFTGFAVIDLSPFIGVLPGINATGFIYSGSSTGEGSVGFLGLWQITSVPEPSTAALAVAGGVMMLVGYRRRR